MFAMYLVARGEEEEEEAPPPSLTPFSHAYVHTTSTAGNKYSDGGNGPGGQKYISFLSGKQGFMLVVQK